MAKKATTLHDILGNDLLPVTNASITFMDDGNSVQAEINDLKEKTQYNKGHYTTEQDLLTSYPNNIENPQSRKGWYAIVGETDSVWIWDIEGNEWSDSGVSSGGVESVNGLDGEVILTGGNINATATIDTNSVTKSVNGHLNDIYSSLENKLTANSENVVFTNTNQDITGLKTIKSDHEYDGVPPSMLELNNNHLGNTRKLGLSTTENFNLYLTSYYPDSENYKYLSELSLQGQYLLFGRIDGQTFSNVNGIVFENNDLYKMHVDYTNQSVDKKRILTESDLLDYATKDELSQEIQNVTDTIPTKVSELTNDSNYATVSQVTANTTLINDINSKIPNQASSTNQLADRDFVNSSLNSIVAFYITYNANGDPFPTKSALTSATTYYSGGQVRTPTRNDYAIVLQDETKDNATTRYIYYNQWEYQYTVNETALTADQLSAINSGITSTLVGKISSNEQMLNSLSEQVATDYAQKSELENYLPLTAGSSKKLTGNLYLTKEAIVSNHVQIKGLDTSGNARGLIGLSNTNDVWINYDNSGKTIVGGSAIQPFTASHHVTDLGIETAAFRNIRGKTIYQNGNQVVDLAAEQTITGTKKFTANNNTFTRTLVLGANTPINFTGMGSGTYNIGAFVCNTTDKFGVECPRESDSASAAVVPFRIGARGGQLGILQAGDIYQNGKKVANKEDIPDVSGKLTGTKFANNASFNTYIPYTESSGGNTTPTYVATFVGNNAVNGLTFSSVSNLKTQMGIPNFVTLTQAEYDALSTKDSNTYYFIKE